jgi:UbiD family decarboxylase
MRDFIEKMRKAGLVVDVQEEVSADMEAPKMAAGTDKLVFFHRIGGSRAVMNLTASRTSLSPHSVSTRRRLSKPLRMPSSTARSLKMAPSQ